MMTNNIKPTDDISKLPEWLSQEHSKKAARTAEHPASP
jgi:hypothetical protein